ncbi:MAG: hypothetical protein GX811_08260 [Lentisphaerae bacterium]|nr:hypothetical protein [Lentisphaerota bacterium]
MANKNAELPDRLTNVSGEEELTLRKQPDFKRMMVHLLNYDVNLKQVPAGTITVNFPEGNKVKRAYYPDTDTEVKTSVSDKGIEIIMRPFEVHDMLVIEWEN